LARLAQPELDVVLLDLGLPDSQGLDTVACVVRDQPALPVIVLTVRDDDALARAALTTGAQDYLVKGTIEPGMLARAIQYACERKRTEVALRNAHEFTNQVILNVQDGIVVYDRDLRYRVWNPYLEAVSGMPAAQVVGHPALGGVSFLPDPSVAAAVNRALSGEVVTVPEIPYRVPDSGREGWTAATFGPLRDAHGAIIGVIGSVRDITARKQAEAERAMLEAQLLHAQRMESIGRLAGGVAHDFKNLLSPILGYAELLLEEVAPGDPRYGHLTEIRQAGERARDLTRQLLAFSRKQILALTAVDLRAVVSGFEKLLRRMLREDIRTVVQLPPTLGSVRADAGQMEQVLMNLAVNAQDAMPGGGILTLELADVVLDESYAAAHAEVTPGPYIVLAVSDTSVGMDAVTQGRLFEPFFTTKATGEGTGLGLSTVYGIVKQHGGHLWVYSEPGRGSTFKVYLPRVEEPATARPASASSAAAIICGTETVMIVEDHASVRDLAQYALERQGYRVLAADTGSRALELGEGHEGPIDLLLTDVILPGLNGRALYKQLAIGRPGLKVICMSGYTEDAIALHGVLDEGIHYLQKPFALHALLHQVREVLAG
jgi:PAS domain S-box-containing protein